VAEHEQLDLLEETEDWDEWVRALPTDTLAPRPTGRIFRGVDLAEAVRTSGGEMSVAEAESILVDFAARGLVERVLRSGWRATPRGLRLSHELARVGVEA
jgi:hypothetical protein